MPQFSLERVLVAYCFTVGTNKVVVVVTRTWAAYNLCKIVMTHYIVNYDLRLKTKKGHMQGTHPTS